MSLINNQTTEEQTIKSEDLRKFVIRKKTELENDKNIRQSGVVGKTGKNLKYAGYDTLRDFFDGDQWSYVPEEGGSMRVYNYIFTTVINYTAFMTNEPVEFDVPPAEITDPIEVERAERKEEILSGILTDNKFSLQFENAVMGGSMLGDSFMVGPFWDAKRKRIKFSYVRKPENIRPIFDSDDYLTIVGYIHDYYMPKEEVMFLYGEKITAKGISLPETPVGSNNNPRYGENTSQNMVHLMQYWDDTYTAIYVNEQEIYFEQHNWGFVPIVHVPNIPHPTRWWGISDVEHILDTQMEYNEKNSDISDIIKGDAYPTIFGKNLSPAQVQGGVMSLIDVGDDAEIIPDPRRGKPSSLEQVVSDRQQDVYRLSGLNEIVYGGAGVRQATGRALSVIMQSVNNRIKGRQERWRIALQELCKNIFILLERYVPNSKEVIGDTYTVDIFFPSSLLRNVTDEINKFSRKLQSRYTTMKNLGVPSPKDEEALMQKELVTDSQLQAQVQAQAQMILNQVMTQMQGQQGTPNQDATLNEGENQGENPAAVAGVSEQSPSSPEGAVAQEGFRKTGTPIINQ